MHAQYQHQYSAHSVFYIYACFEPVELKHDAIDNVRVGFAACLFEKQSFLSANETAEVVLFGHVFNLCV